MKAKRFLLFTFMLIGIIACKYDDDALWDKVNSLDDRVTLIEKQLTQMNSDISSMSVLVNALQNKVNVSEVKEVENGYKIIFSDGKTIVIRNGQDGVSPHIGENDNWWIGDIDTGVKAIGLDGKNGLSPRIGENGNWWIGDQDTGIKAKGKDGKDAPIISVSLFEGKYYWVQLINGVQSWLTDNEGNKLPVTGTDGVTPILRVDAAGFWIISYDKGITFTQILDNDGNPVKALAQDGIDGQDGDSFFSDVKIQDDILILVLKDGTIIRIPLLSDPSSPDNVPYTTIVGKVDIDNPKNLEILTILDEATTNAAGEFTIKVANDKRPQLITVTDEHQNIIMLANDYTLSKSTNTINTETTTLALITSHPLFSLIDKADYDKLITLITNSPLYAPVYSEVERSIQNRQHLFDSNNQALLVSLSNLLENVLSVDNSTPLSRAHITNWEQLNINDPYPFLIEITDNQLSITNTALSPAYDGKVTHPTIGTSRFDIPTRSGYGGMELIMQSIYGWSSGTWGDLGNGDPVHFQFSSEGEYDFEFHRNEFKFYWNLIKDILLELGIPEALVDENTEDILNEFTNHILNQGQPSVENEDPLDVFCEKAEELVDFLTSDDFKNSEKGQKFYNKFTKANTFLPNTKNIFKYWSIIKGASNALLRISMRLQAPEAINFCLCYYEAEVTSCSNVELIKKESSDNQSGYAGQRLLIPIEVLVKAKTEDGTMIQSNYQKVKFEVISGGGSVSETIVGSSGKFFMGTYWTLGQSGEQKVKAVAIDVVTGKAISEPVFFTATLNDSPDITIRLDWTMHSGNTDIDLHVIDPSGEEIYFGNRNSASGGYLDRDDIVGPGPEHVRWNNAPNGTYKVLVRYYPNGDPDQSVVSYRVTVTTKEHSYKPVSGSIAYGQIVPVGQFTFGENASRNIKINVLQSTEPVEKVYPKKKNVL